MKQPLTLLLFFIMLLSKMCLANSDETRRLVLVTDSSSGIKSLTSSETRRLFLGLPVLKQGRSLEAAINHSDPFLYEVFLQRVVYMSSSIYERHLLTNALQLSGQRPQMYNDMRSLVNSLKESPGTVTLLWESDALANPNLVILGEVWHGNVE
jgi:hypothetical protein